ncbi:MAG: hypothetical protein Q8O67_15545 [Deltaproteobacteria bacterium]|nr:hypothetical protein [Deltaproteobacteria bacterium]
MRFTDVVAKHLLPAAALVGLASGCVTRTVYVVDDRDRPAPVAAAPDPRPAPVAVSVSASGGGGEVAYEEEVGIVDDSDFYEPLAPYGSWVAYPGYGRVWRPSVSVVGASFRPYTHGHWENTEWGWTWVDHHPFGWATGHYGRWLYDSSYGWVWVPGTVWSPAWVSWRTGGGYVGWSAMPPGSVYGGSYSVYDTSWVFVSTGHFGSPYVGGVIITGAGYRSCYSSTYDHRTTYVVYGRRYYRGPDYDEVRREGQVIHRPLRETERERPVSRPPTGTVIARGGDRDRDPTTDSRGRDRDRDRDDSGTRGRDRDDNGRGGNDSGSSGNERDGDDSASRGRDRDRDGSTGRDPYVDDRSVVGDRAADVGRASDRGNERDGGDGNERDGDGRDGNDRDGSDRGVITPGRPDGTDRVQPGRPDGTDRVQPGRPDGDDRVQPGTDRDTVRRPPGTSSGRDDDASRPDGVAPVRGDRNAPVRGDVRMPEPEKPRKVYAEDPNRFPSASRPAGRAPPDRAPPPSTGTPSSSPRTGRPAAESKTDAPDEQPAATSSKKKKTAPATTTPSKSKSKSKSKGTATAKPR